MGMMNVPVTLAVAVDADEYAEAFHLLPGMPMRVIIFEAIREAVKTAVMEQVVNEAKGIHAVMRLT